MADFERDAMWSKRSWLESGVISCGGQADAARCPVAEMQQFARCGHDDADSALPVAALVAS